MPDLDRLPSRRSVRDAARAALLGGLGPVLLTGGAGVGKSTLLHGLAAEEVPGHRWAIVEVPRDASPSCLYRLLARSMGVESAGFDRSALLDALADRSLDAERWTIAVDDAHHLDNDGLDELRALSGRLGETDGPAAILIVGPSSFVRRLARGEASSLGVRLAAHLHLRPFDADEAATLLDESRPGHGLSTEAVERLHVAAEGRPGQILALAARLVEASPPSTPLPQSPLPAPVAADPVRPTVWTAPEAVSRPGPLVGPGRPPIRDEEGVIEVGWQPEAEPERSGGRDSIDGLGVSTKPRSSAISSHTEDEENVASDPSDEPIIDHYAALQAWQEWTTNRSEPISTSVETDRSPAEPNRTPLASNRNVWVDEEHGFAPIGRMFGDRGLEVEGVVEDEAEVE